MKPKDKKEWTKENYLANGHKLKTSGLKISLILL